jgi:hypothetical protein
MSFRALLLFLLMLPAVLLPTGARAWLCSCEGWVSGWSAQSCCAEASDESNRPENPLVRAEPSECDCCAKLEVPAQRTPSPKLPQAPEVPDVYPAVVAFAFASEPLRFGGLASRVHAAAPRASPPRAPTPLRL